MTTRQMRDILRAKFGARRYRITVAGEVQAYGAMPNSDHVGWYLLGYVGDQQTEQTIKQWAQG